MASRKTVAELRKEIDAIDEGLLRLLSRRARVAQRIGEAKSRGSRSVLDVGREKAVLQAIHRGNRGPLSAKALEAIFREIVSACRASQQAATVAYLGPAGTFSHEAAIKQFGRTAVFEAVDTIADVFSAVEAGRACWGVVPVENTTEGAVTPTLDALAATSLGIVAEVIVRVDHYLLSISGEAGRVRRVVSHPQPLAQCRRYLADRFPGRSQQPLSSTAAAARLAAKRPATAAIASRLAASLYGLKIVARSIQDNAANVTRFVILGQDRATKPTGKDRTSLVITVRDEVGVLERIVRPFAKHAVNLSMIESRPLAGRPWEYSFFIDVSGHSSQPRLARALAEVEKIAMSTRVLGSYPVAD